MRFFLRGLILLPALLVFSGFGPFAWLIEKQDLRKMTPISLENKTYLSKEEVDQKINASKGQYKTSVSQGYRARTQRGVYFVSATAYSSTVDQCDATPFITASGQHVRDGIIAANFLPFGAKVRIPDMYGDKVFEVQDRMNRRYSSRIDIWMPTRHEALQFGVRRVKIEVL